MNADEQDEADTVSAEIDALDVEIKAMKYEAQIAGDAVGVKSASNSGGKGAPRRGPTVFSRNADPEDKFAGQSFVRGVIARALSFIEMKRGNLISAGDVAAQRWGKSHPKLVEVIRAGVAGAGTGSGEWGAELAGADRVYTGDFIDYLYSKTVYDQLRPLMRTVPAFVHIRGADGAATGYWFGESKPIPVSAGSASDVELSPLQVGALAVASKRILRNSDPSAEQWIRDMLVEASAQRVDSTFLSADAASAGVSPAGLLNGLSPYAPSGTDAAAVRTDIGSLYAPFLSRKDAAGLVQIMTPSMAKGLSLLVNALGQVEFPGLKSSGGELMGDRVFTGDNVTGGDWILLKPSDIWVIGDTGVEISMSDEATIEQDSAPTGASDTPVAQSATPVSMFQTESVAIKIVRGINFQKRRSDAVSYLANGEYGGVFS
jgi:HK97 family phage major capsid protein